jgi:hypothetical protein
VFCWLKSFHTKWRTVGFENRVSFLEDIKFVFQTDIQAGSSTGFRMFLTRQLLFGNTADTPVKSRQGAISSKW